MSQIDQIKQQHHGFIRKEDIPTIINENRFEPLLVRCGGGRFTCPAQNVEHFIEIIGKENSDYVRDVSFPAASY